MDIPTMLMRGERFNLDLESDPEDESIQKSNPPPTSMSQGFVKDIVEKPASSAPTAPILPPTGSSPSGFPEHKKRIRGPSRFKQRAQQQQQQSQAQEWSQAPPPLTAQDRKTDRQRIRDDAERQLRSMSAEEIEEERRELLEKLSPGLIQQLLTRATLHDDSQGSFEDDPPRDQNSPKGSISSQKPAPNPPKRVSMTSVPDEDSSDIQPPPPQLSHIDENLLPPNPNIHFPLPPTTIDTDTLDPSSPEFLSQLHTKYFPTLPSDPSKLAWMSPVTPREDTSYHPSESSLPASALRFDFRGDLLPPRKSREIPGHLGLHHHAEAPNAAGYTIPELARLARSAFPTQRCVAIQTLGRIMYKLGKSVFNNEEITRGLWRCLQEGRVVEGLEEAANANGGHLSVKAHATDALWLWQKGGGQRWSAE